MDISSKITDALPEPLRFYFLLVLGACFLWARYFSHRAFLDLKKRELELIQLANDISGENPETKAEVQKMAQRAVKELKQNLQKQLELNKRLKKGLKEVIQDGVAHYDDKQKCIRFFVWGAGGGCVFLALLTLWLAKVSSFSPSDYKFLWIYGTVIWILSVVFGGAGGVLFAWSNRLQATVGGVLLAGFVILECNPSVVNLVKVMFRY